MNTAVVIVNAITRTVVELAFIGAGLKLALTVAPGLRLTAAPKAPQKRDSEAKADDAAAEPAKNGPVPLEKVS